MKLRIEFASVDCRDDGFCGYHAVGVSGNNRHRMSPVTKEATQFMYDMHYEYLQELARLQDTLRKKYAAKLKQLDKEQFTANWPETDFSTECYREARKNFPGPYANHYD